MEILSSFFHFLSTVALPFVLLLGILVFVHEFGHFIVARLNGVRVEVFSLGFGKKIFQYKKGDTNYCISLVPLGGYVKMFGEQPGDSVTDSDKSVSFTHKSVLQRISIVSAGPLMNLFFAILLFALVSTLGEEKKPAIVGDIEITSPAFEMGFRSGDQILSVGGKSVVTWDDLQNVMNDAQNQDVQFAIKSAGGGEPKNLSGRISSTISPNPLALDRSSGTVEGLQPYSRGPLVAIIKGSLLDSLGIKTGDSIKSINGKSIAFDREASAFEKTLQPKSQLNLVFERMGVKDPEKTEDLNVTIQVPQQATFASLGVEKSDLYLAKVIKNSPAAKAGLQDNDRLLSINGVVLKDWEQVLKAIKEYDTAAGDIKFSVFRNGEKLDLNVTPQMTSYMNAQAKEERRFTIGIIPMISMATEKSLLIKLNPVAAVGSGIKKSYEMTVMTLLSFVRLIEGEISPKNVGGVLSIGQAASESFKAGLNYFLQMMGVISISLFVLNLLPIPVLDGGHLLFYTIELFKGSPVSLKKMELAQQVGLFLLMSLMLFALFNDVNRVFFGSY